MKLIAGTLVWQAKPLIKKSSGSDTVDRTFAYHRLTITGPEWQVQL